MRWFPVREPVSGNRYTVLRVKTRTGLTGWGETGQVAEQDAKALEKAWIGKPATLYAAIEPGSAAGSALDMALLDILGKACKAPVYRVLGGPTRHKVRAFADSQVDGFNAIGITAPKPASRNMGKQYQNQIEALVKQVGEDRDFVLSANGVLTAGDAASVASTLERSHPLWFDEPCPVSNLEVLRKIANENVTPLGFGRGITDPGIFLSLLREGLVDVVRPDIALMGISGARRVAVIAEAYYVAVAPNHDGGPIGTAAAMHIAASVPNFFIQHVPVPADPKDREMRAAIVAGGLETPKDGFLQLPTTPGLGIEVNESALEKYHAA
ncbi:MAG: mandelate racemase/muconate lactonizing enzyme family protein [Candidatus Solibacter sp.]